MCTAPILAPLVSRFSFAHGAPTLIIVNLSNRITFNPMNHDYSKFQNKLDAEAARKREQFFANIKSQPLTQPLGPILNAAGVPIKNAELRRSSILKPSQP